MSSPTATVTSSISSVLDKRVPASSSTDRLSFLSVYKEYAVRDEPNSERSRPRVHFRAVSPFPILATTNQSKAVSSTPSKLSPTDPIRRAPKLGKAKADRPTFYQQMALSECDLTATQSNPCLCHLSLSGESVTEIDQLEGSSHSLNHSDISLECSNQSENSFRHVSVQLAEDTTPCIVHQYSVPDVSYTASCTGEGGDNPLPVVVKEEHPTLTRHPDVDLFSRTDRKLRPDGVSGIWETRAPRLADLVTAVSFDLRSVVRTEAKRGNLKRNKTEADIDPMSGGAELTPMMSGRQSDRKKKRSLRSKSSLAEQPTDEDYKLGVGYPCKYIGSMSLMRPSTRNQILGAMRRVRFEYKARNTKKKKVVMYIGVGGVKVYLNKSLKKMGSRSTRPLDLMLMEEHISNIFFVSHDSQDNLIFSYISRKNQSLLSGPSSSAAMTNAASQQSEPTTFHCHVFKAYKKAQAVLIVHGLGRIFELCQDTPANEEQVADRKLAADAEESRSCDQRESHDLLVADISINRSCDADTKRSLEDSVFLDEREVKPEEKSSLLPTEPKTSWSRLEEQPSANQMVDESPDDTSRRRKKLIDFKQKSCDDLLLNGTGNDNSEDLAQQQQEIQLLWQQLEQQENQIEVAIGQTELLRQQVAIETQARNDAELHMTHNLVLQPILSSSHNANDVPDSGHKEMSTRSSQSEALEELEKERERLNKTLHSLTAPSNSSYQLSSKFETDKLQKNKSLERDLSFTDIARIRVSQSQLPKPEVDRSHDTFCYSPSQSMTLQSKSAVMPNVSEAHDEGVVSTSSAIIPNRNPPNASKLLCTLMVSEAQPLAPHSLRHIPRRSNPSKSITRSVNDIYEKMKVIRRSLESIEPQFPLGYNSSETGSTPANEFTPQRTGKSSATSSTPTSQISAGKLQKLEEHLYADVSELKQGQDPVDGQLPCDTESSQDSRPLLPQRTSQGKKTSESRKKDQPSRSKRHQSSSKRQITQDYENVSVNPLSRSKTYVIHQSAFDLHQPRHTHQKRSLKHHGEMSQSCQSLSLRYTHAPQKVTTLFSPPAFDVLPTRNSATKSHGPSASYFSHLIGAPQQTNHNDTDSPGEEVLFPVRVRSQERGSTLQQREVSLPAEFQPISSQPVLTISRDSLNNSVFEAELDKRLDKLVGISD
ncbi:hypothetical protein EB796_008128 [Bugula neritina]|uniref:PID domain-containing protein n=1 Tax=Bugula neritina TaxID=10212 RepID=A0A7J7K5V4_BUGNE|nr:hypothetical protein EB796_008128 [Bugula neritina]